MSNKQNRFWIFTLNNPKSLLDFDLWKNVRFATYQMEVGENGTPHFQGYVEFTRTTRLAAIKKLPGGKRMHLETRRGTQDEAIAYANKEETRVDGPWSFGEKSGGSGSRSDLLAVKKSIDEGMRGKDLWDSHFVAMVRYHKSFDLYRTISVRPGHRQILVSCYGGPTGVGKTLSATLAYPDAFMLSSTMSGWWDGYSGQETVIIDDFYGWIKFHEMLRILDVYPVQVNCKGSTQQLLARRIIITSNLPCDLWYKKAGLYWNSLLRRINNFIWFESFDLAPIKCSWVEFRGKFTEMLQRIGYSHGEKILEE